MHSKRMPTIILIGLTIFLLSACVPTPDPNIWYVATTGDDSDDCHTPATACLTLEAASDKAVDGNTIFILDGNYIETDAASTSVAVVVDKDLTIEGVGDARIDGDGTRTVMSILSGVSLTLRNLTLHNGSGEGAGGILVEPGAELEMHDSIVRNNIAPALVPTLGLDNAGGIHNRGTANLNDTEIIFNQAVVPTGGHAYGGGIYSEGTLTLTDCRVAMNTSEETASGVYNAAGGTASLVNTMVDDNYIAGGIWNGGEMSLVDSTARQNNVNDPLASLCAGISNTGQLSMSGGVVADNGSPTYYAGICNLDESSSASISGTLITQNIGSGVVNYGTMILEDVEISEHIKGGGFNYNVMELRRSIVKMNISPKAGGIWNVSGEITIEESTISENQASMWGGGLMNNADAIMLVRSSTISDNEATIRGGGLYIAGPAVTTLENTTVSGNLSPEGAGIANNGNLTMKFVTVTNNSAHGISSVNIGLTDFISTIIADNGTADCFGSGYTTLGHNLDSDGTCNLDITLNDIPAAAPLLGPLANNGGLTLTHALLPASPAVEAGASGADCPPADQRGVSRPQGLQCDIGAFELEEELIPSQEPPQEQRPSPTPEPQEDQPPEAEAIMNANCRQGPDKDYKILGTLLEGETAQIDGRNQDASWLWILNPSAQGHCWISTSTVQVTGDINQLPIVAAPSKPEPEPQGCYVYGQTDSELICVVPCPKDAKPGGACTP